MISGREGGIHYKTSLFAWDSLENGQAKDGGELDRLFGRPLLTYPYWTTFWQPDWETR